MIIALPLTENDEFSPHFGAASKVGLFEVDPENRRIERATLVAPATPEPCSWAGWLAGQGVRLFLAGGMGRGAVAAMSQAGIEVVTGVPAGEPRSLVRAWLEAGLELGDNACEGGHHGGDSGDDGHHCGCSH